LVLVLLLRFAVIDDLASTVGWDRKPTEVAHLMPPQHHKSGIIADSLAGITSRLTTPDPSR